MMQVLSKFKVGKPGGLGKHISCHAAGLLAHAHSGRHNASVLGEQICELQGATCFGRCSGLMSVNNYNVAQYGSNTMQ
jgi:hypothetical protein